MSPKEKVYLVEPLLYSLLSEWLSTFQDQKYWPIPLIYNFFSDLTGVHSHFTTKHIFCISSPEKRHSTTLLSILTDHKIQANGKFWLWVVGMVALSMLYMNESQWNRIDDFVHKCAGYSLFFTLRDGNLTFCSFRRLMSTSRDTNSS